MVFVYLLLVVVAVEVSPLLKMWVFYSPVTHCSFLHVVTESRGPYEDQCPKQIASISFLVDKLEI